MSPSTNAAEIFDIEDVNLSFTTFLNRDLTTSG